METKTQNVECGAAVAGAARCYDVAPEPNFCEICCARKVAPPEYPNDSVCQCKGLQPYAMSTYPGEYKLVKSHPKNSGSDWYKREEVDARLDELMHTLDHASDVHKALEEIICMKCLPSQMPRFVAERLAAHHNDEIRRPGPDAPEVNPRRQPGSPASNG
jgi:hypothetical protein